ncbi:MAG TPA: CRTAC1 family protein [Polyangiales bacterium]|nr:CRTAC1 family protein [Polyangiales bacterium]
MLGALLLSGGTGCDAAPAAGEPRCRSCKPSEPETPPETEPIWPDAGQPLGAADLPDLDALLDPPAWSRALHESACAAVGGELPAREPGRFVDVAAAAGVAGPPADPCAESPEECHATSMTGGVAVGDFDADGYPDLYVTHIRATDSLFLNCRNGHFADVTAAMGIIKADAASNGAAWADVDSDGDLDLLVTTFGAHSTRHYLYLQENGAFREDGINRGVAMWNEGPLYGTSVAFGDYDADGYVDVYIGEWRQAIFVPEGAPTRNHARLFHNLGAARPGFFEDVTDQAGVAVGGETNNGIATLEGVFVFTPMWSDLDGDGLLDLALAADYGASKLFWNLGDGHFADGTHVATVGTDQAGMGAAVGDFDGDGLLDWFVSSIYERSRGYNGNRLWANRGDRTFMDATDRSGLRNSGWGWGTTNLDFDNDGDSDWLITSGFTNDEGIVHEYPGQLQLWENPGRAEMARGQRFRDVSAARIPPAAGQGRGVAVLDYDRDGDEDLFVVYQRAPDALLRNDVTDGTNKCLRVLVRSKTNGAGIGAQLRVAADGSPQLRELHAGSGYLSQSESVAHFGLGEAGSLQLQVRWPGSNRLQTFSEVPAPRTLVLVEPE